MGLDMNNRRLVEITLHLSVDGGKVDQSVDQLLILIRLLINNLVYLNRSITLDGSKD